MSLFPLWFWRHRNKFKMELSKSHWSQEEVRETFLFKKSPGVGLVYKQNWIVIKQKEERCPSGLLAQYINLSGKSMLAPMRRFKSRLVISNQTCQHRWSSATERKSAVREELTASSWAVQWLEVSHREKPCTLDPRGSPSLLQNHPGVLPAPGLWTFWRLNCYQHRLPLLILSSSRCLHGISLTTKR